MIKKSILDTLGNTPVIQLAKETENEADVFVKLEMFNPAGSVKDRIAFSMIEAAEAEGKLKKGDRIVEPTSGNTGVALAFIAATKGYPITIVMPESFSIERRKLMMAYGAELVLTPAAGGMKVAIETATSLAEENNWFMPMQFKNEANPRIHEEQTGKEIIEDFKEIGLDALVAGVGTGGTITGVGKVLRNSGLSTLIVAVESEESPVLSGGNPGPHKIQGISAGFVPDVLDTEIYDRIEKVTSDEAILTAREAGKKGLLVGISSGAAIAAARRVARELGSGKTVLAISADNGERYLSTALYDFGE
ncbi:MAG: cysteine synthase A [Streptococcaceae bacterium]|jgi:cysteine synthase A|nr:cysteine synthase A [Streptococcaceae bacterium]